MKWSSSIYTLTVSQFGPNYAKIECSTQLEQIKKHKITNHKSQFCIYFSRKICDACTNPWFFIHKYTNHFAWGPPCSFRTNRKSQITNSNTRKYIHFVWWIYESQLYDLRFMFFRNICNILHKFATVTVDTFFWFAICDFVFFDLLCFSVRGILDCEWSMGSAVHFGSYGMIPCSTILPCTCTIHFVSHEWKVKLVLW